MAVLVYSAAECSVAAAVAFLAAADAYLVQAADAVAAVALLDAAAVAAADTVADFLVADLAAEQLLLAADVAHHTRLLHLRFGFQTEFSSRFLTRLL